MIQVFHAVVGDRTYKSINDAATALSIWKHEVSGVWYEHVANVDTDDMGKVFELTNNIDKPWTENTGVTVIGDKRKRSTSVGDVVLGDDGLHLCARFGWERLV